VDGRFLANLTVPFILHPDTDVIENICENEKDVAAPTCAEHIFVGGLKPQ
jgi:hypothetical protein